MVCVNGAVPPRARGGANRAGWDRSINQLMVADTRVENGEQLSSSDFDTASTTFCDDFSGGATLDHLVRWYPLVASASELDVEINDGVLEISFEIASYAALAVQLPGKDAFDEDGVAAKFDKATHELILVLSPKT